MRVFVTGATGFIGSAVVNDLIQAGHQVLGLSRSDAGAADLAAAGAEVHRGSIEDLDSLRRGAERCEGVIHLAFNHDFSRFAQNCEDDRRVIEAIGRVLKGSDRPFLITSGTLMGSAAPGQPLTEEDSPPSAQAVPRAASELAAARLAAEDVRIAVVRLRQVHDPERQGLISYAILIAREKGAFAYIGDGSNRWAAAPRSDVARLYRLALEKAERGARYHAVAEEGVSLRDIAETVARRLKMPAVSIAPEDAPAHFGWLAAFVGRDGVASSAITRRKLGWDPTGPGLLSDLGQLRVEG